MLVLCMERRGAPRRVDARTATNGRRRRRQQSLPQLPPCTHSVPPHVIVTSSCTPQRLCTAKRGSRRVVIAKTSAACSATLAASTSAIQAKVGGGPFCFRCVARCALCGFCALRVVRFFFVCRLHALRVHALRAHCRGGRRSTAIAKQMDPRSRPPLPPSPHGRSPHLGVRGWIGSSSSSARCGRVNSVLATGPRLAASASS